METNVVVLFTVLALVVLALAIYLGILYGKLRSLKAAQKHAKQQGELARAERESDIKQSLRTLSLVIVQEQCEPTEGCIRVKKLIDEIDFLRDRGELSVFHEMYEEVKDLAILQAYKDLSKQEQFEQDNLRFSVEEKYHSRLNKGAQALYDILENPH